jgi:hypothetical protein
MDERSLRACVLIPLFEAMGFHDVSHHHGGGLEQGKDIVMWRYGDLRERENYAVVAKAGKIRGKVTGSGSCSEVRTQIEQCFDTPYKDPITTAMCHVNRCWVVASGTITKEARLSLDGILQQGHARDTRFVAGDTLWDLVQRFLLRKLVLNSR